MSTCPTILSSSSHLLPVATAVVCSDVFPDNLMMMAGRACAKRARHSARFAMDLVGLAEARSAKADPQVRQDRPANRTDGLLVNSSSLSTTSPTGEGGSDPATFGPTGPARMAGSGEARGGVAPTLAPPRSVTSDSDHAQGGRMGDRRAQTARRPEVMRTILGHDVAAEGETQGETQGARSSAVLLADWRTVTRR